MSGERLAVVEERVESIGSRLDALQSDVRDIRDTLGKQRGFISGVAAAFGLVWTVVIAIVGYVWKS